MHRTVKLIDKKLCIHPLLYIYLLGTQPWCSHVNLYILSAGGHAYDIPVNSAGVDSALSYSFVITQRYFPSNCFDKLVIWKLDSLAPLQLEYLSSVMKILFLIH